MEADLVSLQMPDIEATKQFAIELDRPVAAVPSRLLFAAPVGQPMDQWNSDMALDDALARRP